MEKEPRDGAAFCGTGCVFAGLPQRRELTFYVKSLPPRTLPSFLAACDKVGRERGVAIRRVLKPSERRDFTVRMATRTEEDEEASRVVEWAPSAPLLRVWKKVSMQEESSHALFIDALTRAMSDWQ